MKGLCHNKTNVHNYYTQSSVKYLSQLDPKLEYKHQEKFNLW